MNAKLYKASVLVITHVTAVDEEDAQDFVRELFEEAFSQDCLDSYKIEKLEVIDG